MAQLTDLEKVRKQRLWKKRTRGFFTFLFFSAVVFGISWFIYNKGNVDLRTALGDVAAEITAGSGFPVPVPSGKFSAMESVDGALLITTDSNLDTYNSTGRRLIGFQHGMITPITSVAGGRFLLYDRGAKKAYVYSKNNQLTSLALDFPIYDADLARSGNFAIASGSDKFLSQVVVYNGEGVSLYQCSFIDRPAVSVALADGKDAMMVGLLDVSDGEYISTILRYQFQEDKASNQIELPGEMVLQLTYEDGETVRMLSQKRVALFNSRMKEQASYSFEEYSLARFSQKSDGRLLLYLRQATGSQKGKLVLLDSNLKQVCTIEVTDDTVQNIEIDNNYIYLWREDGLLVYNFEGKELTRARVPGLQMFYPMDNLIYYATSSELCTMPVRELLEMRSEEAMPTPLQQDASSLQSNASGNVSEVSSLPQSRWDQVMEALVGSSSSSASSAQSSSNQQETSSSLAQSSSNSESAASEVIVEAVSSESESSSSESQAQTPQNTSNTQGGQDN